MASHVPRAGDDPVRAADHRALDRVDVGLRVGLHPALVAAPLGRVHRGQPRTADLPRGKLRRAGDQPVVGVHEREIVLLAELVGELAHVGVHRLHPAHERARVLRELRLADAVHEDAVALLLERQPASAAREHVDLGAAGDEVLGELADMPGEAAFDDRRVFPGDQQDAHTAPGTLSVAAWRPRQLAGAAAVLATGAKFGDRRSRKLWTPSAKSGAVNDSSISRLASATVSGSVRS